MSCEAYRTALGFKRGRPRESDTHFNCGHERSEANTYRAAGHTDKCRQCKNAKSREYYQFNREYFLDYMRQYRERRKLRGETQEEPSA